MMPAEPHQGSLVSDIGRFVICFLLAAVIFYFVNLTNDSLFASIFVSAVALILLYFSWKKNFFYFMLATLTGTFFFFSLEISFNLGLLVNFILSFAAAMVALVIYDRKKTDERYAILLLGIFVVVWFILAFNVSYRDGWQLENYLTVPFVIILIAISKWFRFSKTSYILLFIFMTFHAIGGHYTYAEVPFGDWMKNFFDLGRNHYDRIVHFSFGLLLAYPVREIFVRIANARGFWALWGPVELVFGLSAIYEIIEWAAAVIWGGDLGIAFLGSQGDIWDAQKDMGLAGLGSIIAMLVTALVRFTYQGRDYLLEIKESFRSRKGEQGERTIHRLGKKETRNI